MMYYSTLPHPYEYAAIRSPDRSISYIHEGYVGTVARVEYVKENRIDWYILHPDTHEWTQIDPEQLWFWTEEWQRGEREADEELAQGDVLHFDSVDDLIDFLDE